MVEHLRFIFGLDVSVGEQLLGENLGPLREVFLAEETRFVVRITVYVVVLSVEVLCEFEQLGLPQGFCLLLVGLGGGFYILNDRVILTPDCVNCVLAVVQ